MADTTTTKRDATTTDDKSAPAQPAGGMLDAARGQLGAAALQRRIARRRDANEAGGLSGVGGLGHDIGESLEGGHLGDAALDVGGGLVGLAEKALPFFKYAVKPYEAQVSSQLYRGARVDENGMANLKQQGITGIVNLCAENDMDSAPAKQLGMHALHIPIVDNTAPTLDQVHTFLDFVAGNGGPVYVHCEAGQGRTGTMCASYRMAVQGWTAQAAIDEAKRYGMKMPVQIHFLEQYGASLGKGAGPKDAQTTSATPAAAPAQPDKP